MRNIFILVILGLLIGCSPQMDMDSIGSPPPVTVDINDVPYNTKLGTHSWTKKGLFSSTTTVADAPSPNQLAVEMDPVYVESGSEIYIKAENNPTLSVFLWNEDDMEKEVPLEGTKFKVPDEVGLYIYEVVAEWNQGEGSYTIVLEVE